MSAPPLAAILPFDEIDSYFARKVDREEFGKGELSKIKMLCPKDIFSMGTNCAIRAKQIYSPSLDMQPLVRFLSGASPDVLDELTLILGEEALRDIYCCRCRLDDMTVASLLIGEVWPRDLYLGLIMFADPSKPIPISEQRSVLQKFRGMGLLSKFLERLESCAQARGCKNVTLQANETSQKEMFQRYGFIVDGYDSAKSSEQRGQAIPMHKPIS